MKRKVFMIIGILFVLCAAVFYLSHDGSLSYKIQKRCLTPLQIIRYYSSIPLSNSAKVKSYQYEADMPNSECLKATLIVPANEVDKLFSQNMRDNDASHAPIVKNDNEHVHFSSFRYDDVRNWNTHTQRSMNFIVMYPKGDYVTIYVSIDKLGWVRSFFDR